MLAAFHAFAARNLSPRIDKKYNISHNKFNDECYINRQETLYEKSFKENQNLLEAESGRVCQAAQHQFCDGKSVGERSC